MKENKEVGIKESLINQEKFLINFIQAETIYKKHKLKIIFLIVALLFGGIGYYINKSINESSLVESNKAYINLLKNPDDKKSLDILKSKNNKLYSIYQINLALKSKDIDKLQSLKATSDDNFKNIIDYNVASIKEDVALLESYSLQQSALLKEFAVLQVIFKLIEEGKYQDAKDKLVNISATSNLNQYAQVLNHFLVTKVGK